jgi:hypothetical protein
MDRNIFLIIRSKWGRWQFAIPIVRAILPELSRNSESMTGNPEVGRELTITGQCTLSLTEPCFEASLRVSSTKSRVEKWRNSLAEDDSLTLYIDAF